MKNKSSKVPWFVAIFAIAVVAAPFVAIGGFVYGCHSSKGHVQQRAQSTFDRLQNVAFFPGDTSIVYSTGHGDCIDSHPYQVVTKQASTNARLTPTIDSTIASMESRGFKHLVTASFTKTCEQASGARINFQDALNTSETYAVEVRTEISCDEWLQKNPESIDGDEFSSLDLVEQPLHIKFYGDFYSQ